MRNTNEQEEAIFQAALEFTDPGRRQAYIAGACAHNPELRQRVEALFAAQPEEDKFFAEGVAAIVNSTAIVTPLTERPGEMIGRYKLLQKIGEGGCGVVYMAEQEEPVRRRIALKIIKLGMDTKSVIARFEAERQALALMDHPNIAKVHDAGATETGRPYFVMELVRGVKITDYCDEKNLSTRERLELFSQVCHAVQHAHQKGIIHRDIKPANILVTVIDGVAVPKVIDFGIAKTTNDQRLTDKTVFTAFEQFIGTPAYMSPEQAEISGVDVDTRSDIYSLGVLLYELLTGRTPFDAKELLQAGLDEMRRTIREKEPERPSTRVSTLVGDELTAAAKRRGLEAPKLVNTLRGDLDWIVMKCLEKDRARRYETANGLASDIQRHVSNEPVVACPPSRVYRFQKTVRRNKLAFAAGASIAAALLIGLCVATWALIRERAARQLTFAAEKSAQAEAAKSQQVAQFLKDMLAGVGPQVAKGRDATILLEILDKTAERIGKELTSQPAVESDLSVVVGRLYRALGKPEKAEPFLRRALAVRNKVDPGGDRSDVLGSLGDVLFDEGKLPEAEELKREALAIHRHLLGDDADTAVMLSSLAYHLTMRGKLSEAKHLATEALAIIEKLFGRDDPRAALALHTLGLVEDGEKNYDEAEIHLRKAAALLEKEAGDEDSDLQIVRGNLASVLTAERKWQEAEIILRKALVVQERLLGDDHPLVGKILSHLGLNLLEQGKLLEAEDHFRKALDNQRKSLGNGNPGLGLALNNLGGALYRQRKLAEAEPFLREAVDLYRKNPEWPVNLQTTAYDFLGKALAERGNLVEAEAVQYEYLALLRKRDDGQASGATAELAVTLLAEHKFTDAEPIARERLESLQKSFPNGGWSVFSASVLLGESLLGQKKYLDAEPFLLSGYEGMERRRQEGLVLDWRYRRQPQVRKGLELLVQLYEETKRPDRAAEWKQKLAQSDKGEEQTKAPPHESPNTY